MTQSDLDALLEVARSRNQQVGVTGMLIYTGQGFRQTLEGPDEAVEAIFASIQGDPRHHEIVVTQRSEIALRVFPDWSMRFEFLRPPR